ncbi:MAG: putative RNA binding protein YcfA (HicA-like mRNA interferase family) [Clostridium sp.]|jgi:predicted RNA binding protein YcfA (HicA-like mRNA interferase family)
MNSNEIRLMRDFKKKEIEVENYFMTDIADILAEFSDKKGQEKYNLIQNLSTELEETLAKMIDLETYELHMAEYEERFMKLNTTQLETEKYFMREGQFTDELMKEIVQFTKPKTDELGIIIGASEMFRYTKTTNNLKLQYKKFIDRITYIIDESVSNTVEMYKFAINQILIPLQELMDAKVDTYNLLKNPKVINIEEIAKQKIKKIIDCDVMNDFLLENGYAAIRQNGSHLIYRNEINGNSIPVPQHSSLNKGLGYGIQKQIK